MKRYVYRPYHGWRHGYRREKRKKWLMRIIKLLLLAEGLILTMRYVKTHTYENIYEREYLWDVGAEAGEDISEGVYRNFEEAQKDGELYGVGYEPEEGMFFWFHKRNETESPTGQEP